MPKGEGGSVILELLKYAWLIAAALGFLAALFTSIGKATDDKAKGMDIATPWVYYAVFIIASGVGWMLLGQISAGAQPGSTVAESGNTFDLLLKTFNNDLRSHLGSGAVVPTPHQ